MNHSKSSKAFTGVFLALVVSVANGQQNIPAPASQPSAATAGPGGTTPETTLAERLDAIEAQARRPARTSITAEQQSEYNEWVLAYSKQAYAWHQLSTIIIFFMVVCVVASGVVLAAWQLHAWITRVKAYDNIFLHRLEKGLEVSEQMVAGIGQPSGSEITVSEKSVALSSPYVGVVILALSMGFFMAYLLYVYPILQGP